MRRLLKINMDLKKYVYKKETNSISQDVFYNVCRVRDSELNKKRNIVLASKLLDF